MAKSYWSIVKSVFSSRNILAIAITTSMITLCDMGWRPFWSLYLVNELGANVWAVGVLSMIQSSERLLFQLPGGLIADRFGRRKIIVYGTALRILTPILYLMAKTWVQVIPALLVNGVTSIYMPAFNAIIADSLPEEERGAGYGAYRMITSSPQIFSPVIGGILMDMYGYLEGVRIFLFISIFVNLIVTIVRWRVISETLTDDDITRAKQSGTEKIGLTGQVKEKLDLPRTIWVMVVVAILGSVGQRMVMDFLPLYAVEHVGITNTQLGLVRTVSGIITVALAMPGGMISDRFGRKPVILLSRVVTPVSQFVVTFAKSFPQYILIQGTRSLADALGGGGRGGGGGGVGGPAWQALIADIVPREKRATTMGTIGTMTGIVSAPATMLASYLWSSISPATTFHVAAAFGLMSSIIFAFGVKEKREKPEPVISPT